MTGTDFVYWKDSIKNLIGKEFKQIKVDIFSYIVLVSLTFSLVVDWLIVWLIGYLVAYIYLTFTRS